MIRQVRIGCRRCREQGKASDVMRIESMLAASDGAASRGSACNEPTTVCGLIGLIDREGTKIESKSTPGTSKKVTRSDNMPC